VCFDAKINFDDNANFRQASIYKLRDTTEEDPREVEAEKFGLNYIGMDGEIGCLGNSGAYLDFSV
jgi:succinyl-CoA synthetase beta subunit